MHEALCLSKKPFRQAEASFCNFKKLQKLIDLTRMTQVTLSCRFAASHLETPLLGFFRNYLPSRMRALFAFIAIKTVFSYNIPRCSSRILTPMKTRIIPPVISARLL